MDPARLTHFGAVELARSIAAGDVSAREVVDAHIARVEEIDGDLNAVVIRRFDAARAEADAADAARRRGTTLGPLHGVPVTIKDQFHVAGLPTTLGTPRLREHVAREDGPVVAAWRRAGAIVLGKGNVPQLLAAIETDNDVFGRTNHPRDPERTPGGSSGADAAIVAAGGVPLALGGDFGGSLRLPAAWCGIATIAPTGRRFATDAMPGARSAYGVEGIVAVPGPLARSTADVAAALRVMADDAVDRARGQQPPVPWADPTEVDVARLRVALIPEVAGWTPSPAVRRALREAAAALRATGADVETWDDAPDLERAVHLAMAVYTAAGAAPYREMLRGDPPHALLKGDLFMAGLPNTARSLLTRVLRGLGQERAARIVPWTHRRSAAGLLDLLGDRYAFETEMLRALDAGGFDAILLPPTPHPAPRHGSTPEMIDANTAVMAFNLLGMPSGVVPVTTVREGEETDRSPSRDRAVRAVCASEVGSAGLPVGVMVAARHWREDVVLAVMEAIEAAAAPAALAAAARQGARPTLGSTAAPHP
jgi:fatty acid amide hydrolase